MERDELQHAYDMAHAYVAEHGIPADGGVEDCNDRGDQVDFMVRHQGEVVATLHVHHNRKRGVWSIGRVGNTR